MYTIYSRKTINPKMFLFICFFYPGQPQLENPDHQHKVYTGHVNNTIAVTIPVFGYPEPSLYLDSDRDLNKDAYSLTYISQGPSYGVVSLKISTVTVAVFQSYKLFVTNNEGALVYNFQIQEGGSLTVPSYCLNYASVEHLRYFNIDGCLFLNPVACCSSLNAIEWHNSAHSERRPFTYEIQCLCTISG